MIHTHALALPSVYRLFNDAGLTLHIIVSRHSPIEFIEKHRRLSWVPFIYDWETLAENISSATASALRKEMINKYKPLFINLTPIDYTQPVNPNPIPRSDDQARLITYALRNVPKR